MMAIPSVNSVIAKFPHELTPTRLAKKRTWKDSQMVPFSGRMITEKLECRRRGKREGEYARVLVNDAIQPLAFCGAQGDGLCILANFVESQDYARNNGEGDWVLCFAEREV